MNIGYKNSVRRRFIKLQQERNSELFGRKKRSRIIAHMNGNAVRPTRIRDTIHRKSRKRATSKRKRVLGNEYATTTIEEFDCKVQRQKRLIWLTSPKADKNKAGPRASSTEITLLHPLAWLLPRADWHSYNRSRVLRHD